MTSRPQEIPIRRQSTLAKARRLHLPTWLVAGRTAYIAALVTFAMASTYTATVLLARVYPALFPGQSLLSNPVLAPLQQVPIGISTPGDTSVFNKRINVLVLGVDQRAGGHGKPGEGNLTDTIMVVTVDPLQKTMSLLSVPRDLLINISLPDGGHYEDRVNTSYEAGLKHGGGKPDAGAQQVEADLKANFGIQVDHWVLLDFAGVEQLIDAVGGIDLDIPADLAVGDWYYSDDDVNGVWLTFPPGPAKMNGYQAVAFGRYRETDNDMARVRRQQLVVNAAIQKSFQIGAWSHALELWDSYSGLVKTDISRSRLPGYALLLKATGGKLKTYSLGDPVNGVDTLSDYTTPEGAAVLKWNPANVRHIVDEVFSGPQPSQADLLPGEPHGAGEEPLPGGVGGH